MPLATIDPLPAELMRRGDPEAVKAQLLELIKDAIANHPRSLQKRIGPSEVGHPCARRIGYILLGGEPLNPFPDTPWKPTIGTAVHAWLEEAFMAANDADPSGWTRWLVELTVAVGTILGVEITGHCDLYDRVTATAVDWKIVGDTPLKKYRSKGPGDQYRKQIHLYGRGLTARGLPVDTVAIAFLPRNGELRDAYLWHEPYDEQVALAALQRAEGVALTVQALGTGGLQHLEAVEAYCSRCPFHVRNSTDLAKGCPGVDVGTAAPALTLI
jgi:hypothetical protein